MNTSFECRFFCSIGLFLALSPRSYGQAKNELQTLQSDKDYTIHIGVEEVRLDAVVLDGRGRQISDLTAGDFEIYQDDQLQQVLSCRYISEQTAPPVKLEAQGKRSKSPPIPARSLEQGQVRRVIAFIVDDLTMSFEQVHYARMALTRFVERQMQQGDLMAILRTSHGNSALQMFLSDKQQLLARINRVRWGVNVGHEYDEDNLQPVFEASLSYCIRALKNMPGRKSLVVLTPTISGGSNRLADEALRAGVVINMLDIHGLEAPFPGPSFGGSPTFAQLLARKIQTLNSMPQKTGGFLIMDSNFFLNGVGNEVNNALKGYYILSYAPPPNTFKLNSKDIYHRIKIKVKRRGAAVHSRDGFYGTTEIKEESASVPNALRDAIFSPFQNTDLKVNLLSGYINDFKSGYVIRSWLHLDPENVTIVKNKNGSNVISLETVCVTSDINGYIEESRIMKYDFGVKDENLSWVKEQGIRFSLSLAVKKPGSYYVRVAIKDRVSGKIGSAYQFVDIPDLKKNHLALSNIFVINDEKDAAWIRSGVTKDNDTTWFNPILSRDESRSPALRTYFPGDRFEYMSVIYNAKHEKETPPELETQFLLFKDGAELLRSEPQILNILDFANPDRIPIRRRLLLSNSLQPGDYVLQLLVADKKRNKKSGVASQTLSFEIPAINSSSSPGGN